MTRRLSRLDPEGVEQMVPEVINEFNSKLIYSGYPWDRIIKGGISYFWRRLKIYRDTGKIYRTA